MKIVSWNTEGRLTSFATTGRGTPEHILAGLEKLDGDVVFLAEASDNDLIEPTVIERLEDLNYKVYTVSYEDAGERKWAAEKAPNMKLLSRLEVTSFHKVRPSDLRNMLIVDVKESQTGQLIRIFGVHLDDRSEASRVAQVKDLTPYIADSQVPVVVMGDCNAMHANSLPARLLRNRLVSVFFALLPPGRVKNALSRLSGMAIGSTLALLENTTGLVEADPSYHPTSTPKMRYQEWLPSIRMVQIDHIFISKDIKISDFQVSPDGGSDHRAISATIDLKL